MGTAQTRSRLLGFLVSAALVVATAMPLSLLAPVPSSAAANPLPQIWPTPQWVQDRHDIVPVTPNVALVTGAKTDSSAVQVVKQVLARAEVAQVRVVSDADPAPDAGLTIYVGGPSENSASDQALDEIGIADDATGLPRDGYVLGIGKGSDGKARAVLDGIDPTGTFYAAQTLRQLLVSHPGRYVFPALAVRDWPAMPLRGVIEGFYGQPWSQQDRLSQLEFYGRTKQNIYVYSPKDDPYLREQWRQPYPADKLAPIQQLVETAVRNHVEFTYALSPGLSVCYSSDGDGQALVDKFQSLWDVGVRSFAIPLDDISYTRWNCPQDAAKFGTGGGAAGEAQAYLLNRVQRDFIATHPGAERLQTVPTEYYDVTDSSYKTALRTNLDAQIIVEWTGVGVVAPVITTGQAKSARHVFDHDILVWDNYPVNDYVTNRLLLGPYVGREPGIEQHLVGVTANPMIQAEASKIAEFTSGAFFWNPGAYDPAAAWVAALQDLGGRVWPALRVFAENNYSSNINPVESPTLKPLIDAFWSAYPSGEGLDGAAAKVADYFGQLAAAPAVLRSGLHNPALLDEIKPWLDKLGFYGEAGQHAVRMLLAQRAGDSPTAWSQRQAFDNARGRAAGISQSVAPGVVPPFLDRAAATSDRWLGATGGRATGSTSMGQWQANSPANMVDGNLSTFYWSNRAANPGDFVGVDLGSVQEISKIDLYMSKPTSPSDYIRQGVLEFSADGSTWNPLGNYADQPEIHATVPAGTKARYVRMRATAAQGTWVVVREFQVTAVGGTTLTATGAPAAAAGSSLAKAVDGDVGTPYVAGRAPERGEFLQVTLSQTRPLDQVVVLQSGSPATAAVQVRSADGSWTSIGELSGGYTQLDAGGLKADAVRLAWQEGSPAPQINEVVPWFADTPVAGLSMEPGSADAEAGGQAATTSVHLVSTRARNVAGTLTVTAPAGLAAQPSTQAITIVRGQEEAVPVTVTAAAGTPTGSYDVPVVFTAGAESVSATLTVHVYPKTSDTNVALAATGGTATASSTEQALAQFTPDHAIDGDRSTRWSSNQVDDEWLQVELAQPQRIGRVVLRWEAAYAKAYLIQTSSDGASWTTAVAVTAGDGGVDTLRFDAPEAKFVRMQGVQRGTGYGYSLYEIEVYPVAP